jgi:hypothetical protein
MIALEREKVMLDSVAVQFATMQSQKTEVHAGELEPETSATQESATPREWEIPAHKEVDPFDDDYELVNDRTAFIGDMPGLISSVKAAVERGFHVFGLTPKDKIPLPGSQGFKDSKPPSDPLVLSPWEQDSNRNIGIDLGLSDLCVLDFDKPDSIPAWLNELKTYKVRTAKGVHLYFRGARKTTKLYVNNQVVGDIKSAGGYVLAAGSVHPEGPVYTTIDNSEIAPLPERVNELTHRDSPSFVDDHAPIISGTRNTTLTQILGKARQHLAMDREQLLAYGLSVNEKQCVPPLPESEVKRIANSVGGYAVKPSGMIVFDSAGGAGSTTATSAPSDWQNKFLSVGELEEGEVRMLIDGFLPEGTAFIGGLPGEGKTLFALSIARALTTGKPFLEHFPVQKIIPVIYLIPESGGRAFRKRCEKFEIPKDRSKFLCRTVSEGSTLPLDDTSLLEAVRNMRPVVILDTVIRFSEAEDENAAAQNKKLVDDVIRLRQAGAVAVIGLHHATKKMRTEGMSLELALRGTGDIAASADAVYGLLRDHMLYNNGEGPNQIQVACLKPRDFEPPVPFRIASTKRPVVTHEPGMLVGMESIIDHNHDFQIISRVTQANDTDKRIEALVTETPEITLKGLKEKTGLSEWDVRKAIERLKYHRGRGGRKGATHWTKVPERVDTSTRRVESDEPEEPDVSFGQVAA